MTKQTVDLSKMQGLLATKTNPVVPASDGAQRGSGVVSLVKDEKTKASKDEIVNLSFKVPSEFRKRFKLAAIHRGITQNELLQLALIAWEGRKV